MAEIKAKEPHILIDVLLRDCIPSEHKAQVQGALWIAEREWLDFVAYWPTLPPFVERQFRDEEYIRILEDEVNRFNDELDKIVDKISAYGTMREYMRAAE